MESCHPVGTVGKMNVHMSHVYDSILIQDGCGIILGALFSHLIQRPDNRHQLRNHLLQEAYRPLFQSFRQDGVVRIRTCIRNNLGRFLKLDAFFHKQPDQLRYHHRRMGIVYLDGHILCQIMIVRAPFPALFQNHLGSGAYHKILLVNPQKSSGIITVVWIKEKGKILFYVFLVKSNPLLNQRLVYCIQVKQVQFVGSALISCHVKLIQTCLIILPCQAYRIRFSCIFCPLIGFHPEVRLFTLKILPEILTEQTAVIPNTDTVPRKA